MKESFIVGLVAVSVLGAAAQWLGWRLRLPAILLLLGFGIAAGPEGFGLVPTDAMFGDLLLPFVAVSVAILLFEGALTLHLPELGARLRVVFKLVTLGAGVTWLLAALCARFLLDLSWPLSTLLGAVLTVTGPTVVLPLLRQIRPTGPSGTILKWEGIVIDPIGAVLAVLVFEGLVHGGFAPALAGIGKTILFGGVFGALAAWLLTEFLARFWIPDRLHSASALALALLSYGLANQFQHEAGLLAVTVMGAVLANQRRVDISHILEFKENLQVLLISSLFILLAARVQWAELSGLGLPEFLFLGALVFVVRPASVWACTRGEDLSRHDKILLAAMAPRGVVAAAVTAVFALRLEAEGFSGATRLVPIMFLVIAGSVAVYGLGGRPLAIRLGLAQRDPNGVMIIGAHEFGRALGSALKDAGVPVLVVDTNPRRIATARMEGLRAYHGSVLNEHADDELELPGIGKLFAVTANDEVNALSARHFIHLFGRKNIFQLAPRKKAAKGATELATELRARVLFGEELTYEELMRRFTGDAQFKTTLLTDQFGLQQWHEQHGEHALALLTIAKNTTVTVGTSNHPLDPQPGDTLLGLVGANPDSS